MDRNLCPSDYDELATRFFSDAGQVRKWLRKRGVVPDELDDAVQEIFVTFMSRGVLEQYDPLTQHVGRDGKMYKAKFPSLIKGFTQTYALGIRDKNKRHTHREPLWADAPVGRDDEGSTMLWIEFHGAGEHPDTGPIDLMLEITRARNNLYGKTDHGYDLVEVLDVMLDLAEEDGGISRPKLAERLGMKIQSGPNAGQPAKAMAANVFNAVKAELAEMNFCDVSAA